MIDMKVKEFKVVEDLITKMIESKEQEATMMITITKEEISKAEIKLLMTMSF